MFLLLALGLADAAYRNGMELSWFHHGNPMPDNAGAFAPSAAIDSSHVAAATPERHDAPMASLAMLPLSHRKGTESTSGGGSAPLQLASAAEDPNDILSGTGSLDGISPSAGVAGTPPAAAGESGGGAGDSSSPAGGGDASGGGGGGSNAGSGSGSGSGGGGGGGSSGPIFGTSPTGGNTTTPPTDPTNPTGPTDPTDPTGPTNPTGPSDPGGGITSPVPEPSSLAMMALAAAAIALRRKRQQAR